MASTPPPLPSSDEGEFDDDDFGCFASSAPVIAGLDSGSEHETGYNQALSRENNISADSGDNSISDDSTKQTPHSIVKSDNGSNVICNGEKTDSEHTEVPLPFSMQGVSNEGVKSNENSGDPATACPTEDVLQNENMSNAGTNPQVFSHAVTDLPDLKDSTIENVNEMENNAYGTFSEVNDEEADDEADDWADFSSAPSEFSAFPEDGQTITSTEEWNTSEFSHPSGLKESVPTKPDYESAPTTSHNESAITASDGENVPTAVDSRNASTASDRENAPIAPHCESAPTAPVSRNVPICDAESAAMAPDGDDAPTATDSENGSKAPDGVNHSHHDTLESDDSVTVNKGSEPGMHVESSCDDTVIEQSENNCEIADDHGNYRSSEDNNENQSVSESTTDPCIVNESQPKTGSMETSDTPDNPVVQPPTFSDGDDDDEFGDFSDFASHKTKDIISKEEDVAPISFRASTCEDDDLENEEDDQDDFGKFDSNSEMKGESPMPYGDKNDDGDEEDWGFKAAESFPSQTKDDDEDDFGDFGSSNQGQTDDADWASFSESTASKITAGTITEDTADFNEDDFQSPVSSSTSVKLQYKQGLNKLERAVSTSFPQDGQMYFHQPVSMSKTNDEKSNEDEGSPGSDDDNMKSLDSVVEMGLKTQTSAKRETWTITKEIRIKDPMIGLWERLKDINGCHALDFGWTSSHCSQEVYSTLHIDTQNVLFSQKKQAVPFFASGLGILEPIRGGSNQSEKQNTPPPQPLLDTSKPEESMKEIPQDIPPVDFDWSSSGLTDPLKVFNSGLSSLEPFAEILQKSAEASQGVSDKELSPEALSILSKIPNLSFMQSKVLMFPIKDP